jgi:AhpD family alkylhydroperoxidase
MATKQNGPQGAVRQEIEQMFGFVPDFYETLPSVVIEHAWGMHRDLELGKSALDNKTKELIGLAVAAHIKCKYCVYFHDKAARAFGATEQEIKEAIGMGGLTGLFSDAMNGAQVEFEEFTDQVDRAIDYVVAHPPGSAASAKQGARPRA